MKTNLLLTLLLTCATAAVAQSSKVHTWTNKQGRVIQAKFAGLDGSLVVLDVNGNRLKIPMASLSAESVALAKSLVGTNAPAVVAGIEGARPRDTTPEYAKSTPGTGLPPEWEKRHLDVLALFENTKEPAPAAGTGQSAQNGASAADQGPPYRDFSGAPKDLTSLTEGVSSLTVVGEVASRLEKRHVGRWETDSMNSEAILIDLSGWLITAQGAVNLQRDLQMHFQTKKEVRIERAHFTGANLFMLCRNMADGTCHVFRHAGKLEHLYDVTQRLLELGISNESVPVGPNGDEKFCFTGGTMAWRVEGFARLVHISPQGVKVLAVCAKDSGELYTQEGVLVGTRAEEKFPSIHPDGTISIITEHLYHPSRGPQRQGLVFLKDGTVDRISPQDLATGVLGADAQPRSVTTPSGRTFDLKWEMRVHGKKVGQDGRIYLLLDAKYDRANPAGIVTEQKSWHIAAVDGRKIIPLFHSGEQPGLPPILKEIDAIAPQPDGSVYARLFTHGGYMLGRVADGHFRVLWRDGAKYVDEAGQLSTLSESSRPILAYNSHFVMPRRNAKGDLPYVVCEDTDLTPLIQAAEAGEVKAMTSVAGRYLKGDGVPKDPARAIQLYEQAAALGDRDAMFELGYCHSEGKGVEKNEEKAANWFQKAANAGHSMALYNLGVCYENARGVPKNEGQAFDCYIRAAQQGLPAAVFILALSYDTGMGSFVRKDTELAHALCLMAARLGSVDAQNALDRLSRQWRKNAVAAGMEAVNQAQNDAAYRYRKKMRDWQEQQAGRYPR